MAKKLFHFDGNYDFLSRSAITKKFVFVCSAHIIFNIGNYDLEIAFLGTGWNLLTRVNFFCSFSTLAEIPLEGISHHTNLKKRLNFLRRISYSYTITTILTCKTPRHIKLNFTELNWYSIGFASTHLTLLQMQ